MAKSKRASKPKKTFVVIVGTPRGTYGNPEAVGPFSTEADAETWKSGLGDGRIREVCDIVELEPPESVTY